MTEPLRCTDAGTAPSDANRPRTSPAQSPFSALTVHVMFPAPRPSRTAAYDRPPRTPAAVRVRRHPALMRRTATRPESRPHPGREDTTGPRSRPAERLT
ncbi:hypothetical protein ACIBG4_05655 [Nonomuraea sp. NPDC050383]|uniref:hypothetical protein n=1 Tax=Nonomuraea sp. NPDC050383 TaxID=3364362 RepID=UPI00379F908B